MTFGYSKGRGGAFGYTGRGSGVAAFTQQALFAAGEKGGYWLASDAAARKQSGTRAAPGAAAVAANDVVGLLQDETANQDDLLGAGTAKPTLQLDGAARPFFLFDGVDDLLQMASMPPGTGDKGTFWFVFGLPNIVGNKGLFGSGTFLGRCWGYIGTSNLNLSASGATGAPVHGYTGIIGTAPQVLVIQVDLAAATLAAAFKVYVNGVLKAPNSATGTLPGGGPWQQGAFVLGDSPQAGVFGNEQIYAAGVRFALTSDSDIAKLNTNLGNIVGLTI